MIRTKVPKSQKAAEMGFFDVPTNWEKHWKGMPEFIPIMRNVCHCEFTVRVRTEGDLKQLSKLLDQEISVRTKTIWYPKLVRERTKHKKYIYEQKS